MTILKKNHQSKTNKYDATIDALKVRKRIEYLKTDGCERIKRDYNKNLKDIGMMKFIIRDRLRKAELWKKRKMLQKHIKYVKVLKRILVKIFLVCPLLKLN